MNEKEEERMYHEPDQYEHLREQRGEFLSAFIGAALLVALGWVVTVLALAVHP